MLLTRYQAWFTIPLMFLEGLNLHVAGVRALMHRTRYRRSRPVETVLLAVHAGGYLTVLFLVLSPGHALAFVAVQQGLFGLYLGASFAPNHKGMPILPAGDKTSYLRRQVMTARNVRGGPFTDLLLGGLNYQIEHHLFPSMPRPNLRRAQAIVRSHCHARNVPYQEDGLLASYAAGLRHLGAMGATTGA
jgi:fatty acid desaturase